MVIQPNCVGTFFPGDADALRAQVEEYLQTAARARVAVESRSRPKAIIVPHAGYDYSGPIAASAYATLAGRGARIRRVVLLGTCHVSPAFGILTTSADAFATPLGRVPVDKPAVEQAVRLPQVKIHDEAHRVDHALAVQLPWLQLTLEEFAVVPFLVALCEAAQVAEVLELLWDGDETLIVVSSDLSHFLSYEEASRHDRQTATAIERCDATTLGGEDACGFRAISGLLTAARQHRLEAHTADLRNSGDTAGDRCRVVGYGAFLFEKPEESPCEA